jgi:hypothetical protein
MEMKISENGTPYIQLKNGRFIFSRITAHPDKGFKYLCFVGTDTTSVCVSSAKAKHKKYSDIVEDVAFTVRLSDFRRSDADGFPKKKIKGQISNISLNWIKKLISERINDEFLPYKAIPDIMTSINYEDETDEWNEDPDIDDEEDDLEDLEEEVKRPLKKGNGNRGRKLKVKIKPKIKFNRKAK